MVQHRLLARGIGVAAIGVSAWMVGCSAEPQGPADGDGQTEVSGAAATVACPTGQAAKDGQSAAAAVLRYVLGGPNPPWAWPTGPGCADLKPQADAWRYYLSSVPIPNQYVRSHYTVGYKGVCGVPATVHRFELWDLYADPDNPNVNPGAGLTNAIRSCYPQAAPFFNVASSFDRYDDALGRHYMLFDSDPEPAILNYTLGAGDGATALAHGETNPSVLYNARRFASSYLAKSGRDAWIGAPCVSGTTAVGAGYRLTKFVAVHPTNANYIACQ